MTSSIHHPRPLPFGRYLQRYPRTVEAAAAAETPAVYRRQRRNLCPHHHCHSPCHHRSRVRHHRRHPRLNDHSLPTPRTGRAHLAPSPPPPPSISKARRCRSRHPRRRHRPCHHLGRNRRRCRALRRVAGPYGPSAPTVKKETGLVTVISRAHCGVRRSSLVLWSFHNYERKYL